MFGGMNDPFTSYFGVQARVAGFYLHMTSNHFYVAAKRRSRMGELASWIEQVQFTNIGYIEFTAPFSTTHLSFAEALGG